MSAICGGWVVLHSYQVPGSTGMCVQVNGYGVARLRFAFPFTSVLRKPLFVRQMEDARANHLVVGRKSVRLEFGELVIAGDHPKLRGVRKRLLAT